MTEGSLYERVERLFHAALDLPLAEGRRQYLDQACEGDSRTRQEVERLLEVYEEDQLFLEKCAAAGIAEAEMEKAGDRVDRFQLVNEVGEGGFGVVWRAAQEKSVRRVVALKIVKLGMSTREVLARFEQERQALAILDHPHIAKLFDAGATPGGRPLFAMEFVDGLRITDFCDAQRLTTTERLKLFVHVCQAVQHAHQKGIIHRDLKPSNILVAMQDGEPTPKVIDFGVAKATQERLIDETLVTRTQQLIGTPHYLSPEQAAGASDIDTRSDIYSLGVLLFELLTGELPFAHLAAANFDDLRSAIRQTPARRPSTALTSMAPQKLIAAAQQRNGESANLIASVRGDLDWIVICALEKERERRYSTAAAFAEDIERHLTCKLVHARPPSAAYRLQTFARRNKVSLVAAAAVALALVVGVAVSAWQAFRAKRALAELAKSAPAFVQQAERLALEDHFDEAVNRLEYAERLSPNDAEVLSKKGDLLQAMLRLSEARMAYEAALRVDPNHVHSKQSIEFCDKLLEAGLSGDSQAREKSFRQLLDVMTAQQRSAAELRKVALQIGEERSVRLQYWLARLQNLPLATDRPLKDQLTMHDDGLLALDLSATKVASLEPLREMPLVELNCADCPRVVDISPLDAMPLCSLDLSGTTVSDIAVIATLTQLESLNLAGSKLASVNLKASRKLKRLNISNSEVRELSGLQSLALEELEMSNTRVIDLTPLHGMPLKRFVAEKLKAEDLRPIATCPLQHLNLRGKEYLDLSILAQAPLQELYLGNCGIDSRETLQNFSDLEILEFPLPYMNNRLISLVRGLKRLRLTSFCDEYKPSQPFVPFTSFLSMGG